MYNMQFYTVTDTGH